MNIKLRKFLRKLGFPMRLTLGEIDTLFMSEIQITQMYKDIEAIHDFKFVEDTNDFICPDCNIGMCELIIPEVIMNNLKLTECNNCQNRRYKDFSFIDLSKPKENDNDNSNTE